MVLDWLLEVNRLVKTHDKAAKRRDGLEHWEKSTRARLERLGWGEGLINDHVKTVLDQHEFLIPTFDD